MLAVLEGALVRRLEEFTPVPRVFSVSDLQGVKENAQPDQALFVVLDGYRVVKCEAEAKFAQVDLRWLVVVAVRNARQTDAAASVRDTAGAIMQSVIQTLLGWRPPGASGAVRLTDALRPGRSDQFSYYPLGFAVATILKGDL